MYYIYLFGDINEIQIKPAKASTRSRYMIPDDYLPESWEWVILLD